jgi:hypothetical protein
MVGEEDLFPLSFHYREISGLYESSYARRLESLQDKNPLLHKKIIEKFAIIITKITKIAKKRKVNRKLLKWNPPNESEVRKNELRRKSGWRTWKTHKSGWRTRQTHKRLKFIEVRFTTQMHHQKIKLNRRFGVNWGISPPFLTMKAVALK